MFASKLTRRAAVSASAGLALALSLSACGGNVSDSGAAADGSEFPSGP